MKFIDTAGRVDAFRTKQSQARKQVISKTEKRRLKAKRKIEKELEKPTTLAELRKDTKNKKQTKN